jgi:hypothetical protein
VSVGGASRHGKGECSALIDFDISVPARSLMMAYHRSYFEGISNICVGLVLLWKSVGQSWDSMTCVRVENDRD